MTTTPVLRDERTVAVENASYRWAYSVLVLGLFLDMIYRAMIRDGVTTIGTAMVQHNMDVFGLIVLSGLVATGYQAYNRVLGYFRKPGFFWRKAFRILLGILLGMALGQALSSLR